MPTAGLWDRRAILIVGVLVGRVLSAVGILFALVGIFALDGISIELPGIMLGGLGYYFGLQGRDRPGQILGISAVVLCRRLHPREWPGRPPTVA